MSPAGIPERVRIMEVGPRDGLQNEPGVVPTETKIRFIRSLAEAGLSDIEVTSFVSPKAVPQLADAADVCAALPRGESLRLVALVPNEKGLERAMGAGIRSVAVFTAASESFTKQNIRMTIDESFEAFRPVAERARQSGLWLRGYVSTAFACPYEGVVDPLKVAEVTERLFDLGADEISIGDTIGVAVPSDVDRLLELLLKRFPAEKLAMHFHDTRGTAIANVEASLRAGISVFDSSAGGLGGCPYAPGAGGNLATEDLLYLLDGLGIHTGVDLGKVMEVSNELARSLGRPLTSKVLQAGGAMHPLGPAS